jgi:L-asparaginase / beta-aspartyl-peptidase
MSKAVLLIHAGTSLMAAEISKEQAFEYEGALSEALQAGYNILKGNGSGLDAVEIAVKVMEDFPYFNAGRGAVISNSGICELDASVMDGKNKKAGAVAGITIAKNPIVVARAVMENTDNVLIAGNGADTFAKEQELEIVDPSYFLTEHRLEQFKKVQFEEEVAQKNKMGTVGAVAVDRDGNLAAATSTGGRLNNKRHGRVGDSAIIGAGTYADNSTCAVSCTGHGEMFIRHVVAHDIAALMRYKGLSVQEAANLVICEKLLQADGRGGAIVIDQGGNYAMPFNTERMIRGSISAGGSIETHGYR